MKFTVYKNDFVDALGFVMKSATGKSNTPILSAVKLDAQENKLTLAATDLTTAAQCIIPISTDEAGTVAVDASTLFQAASKCADSTMSLNIDKNVLKIKSGGSFFELLTFNADDFPSIQRPASFPYEMRGIVFRELVKKTAFAAAKDDVRQTFMGVNINFDRTGFSAAATNTHHLAFFKAPSSGAENLKDFNIIVPVSSLKILVDYVPKDFEEKVFFAVEGNRLHCRFSNIFFQTRLIDSEFPSAKSFLERQYDKHVRFKRSELKDALGRVAFLARRSKENLVHLFIENGKISVQTNSVEFGNAHDFIAAQANCDSFSVALNINYLSAFLAAHDSEELLAEFASATDPLRFTAVDDKDFAFIITPVRT